MVGLTPTAIHTRLTRSASPGPRAVALAALALVIAAAGQAGLVTPARAAGRYVAGADCQTTLGAGPHVVHVSAGGLRRSALVEIPSGGPARRPLVLALHGWGGSGSKMASYSGLSPVAARAGFVIAYPSSHGPGWNSTASRRGADDVAFLRVLVARLQAQACTDPHALFLTGVSNGASMVALAACGMGAQIRAIAPVAGDYDQQPLCHAWRRLSVLEIHGTADQEVAYFGASRTPTRDGVPPFVNAWVSRDRCSPTHTTQQIASRTRRYRWTRCPGGLTVEHIQIQGGRHQWPGASPPDPGPPATICAACVIGSFFSSLAPRPPSSGGAAMTAADRASSSED